MAEKFKKILATCLNQKRVFLVLCASFLILSAPAIAHADNSSWWSSLFGAGIGGVLAIAIGWPVFILNYILSAILGMFVPLISYFIGVVLQLNMNIIRSNMVGAGFTITLSLANLGFVLSIIIIAIMTILRIETYALKKTLWKLVMAAVLVNFSLVIAGAILNFSDTLSSYFLDSINPAGGDSSAYNFASTLAGSFGPQRIFLEGNPSVNSANGNSYTASVTGGSGSSLDFWSGAGQSFGGALTLILNAFFPTIFLAVADIALGGLFVMLLIRYVYIGILLIIMPMAWLLWIFPLTSGQWQKWWSKFIQWTMFAPIVLFFIWLSILTMGSSSSDNIQGIVFQSPAQNSIIAGISNVIGNLLSGILGPLIQMTMMIAMLFAGLFMAQSMGITFAKTTIGGASWVTSGIGRGVGGFAKRRGLIAGGAVMRRPGVQKLAEVSRQYGADRGVLGRVVSLPSRLAGRAIEATTVATTENLIKDAEKRLANQTREQLENGIPSTFTTPEKLAATKLLFEKGAIEKLDESNIKEADFQNYGQMAFRKKFDSQGRLANEEILVSLQDAMSGNFDKLDKAMEKFVATLSKSDISQNKQLNDIFGGGKFMGRDAQQMKILNETMIKQMAISNPQLLSTIIPKLKGSSLENFRMMFDFAKKEMTPEQREKAEDRFDKIISNNIFYAGTGPEGTGTTTPPPPPPSATH